MERRLNVLIACEESQAVCKAFRTLGHRAFSCDIQECSGGHPEWHICADALPLIDGDCTFVTQDTHTHTQTGQWDILIAHPPCTYLTVTANRWYNIERYGQQAVERLQLRQEAIEFFMAFINARCEHIAVENPIGCMSSVYCKPSQIIQPWQFGHPTTKATCLWEKALPQLIPTNVVEVDRSDIYEYVAANGRIKHDSHNRSKMKKSERAKVRSKTPAGIAQAMAEQWSDAVLGGMI